MFAGCLFKGSEGEQDLVKKCSDRLHTVQLDVTDKRQVAQAAEIVQQKLCKDGECSFSINLLLKKSCFIISIKDNKKVDFTLYNWMLQINGRLQWLQKICSQK